MEAQGLLNATFGGAEEMIVRYFLPLGEWIETFLLAFRTPFKQFKHNIGSYINCCMFPMIILINPSGKRLAGSSSTTSLSDHCFQVPNPVEHQLHGLVSLDLESRPAKLRPYVSQRRVMPLLGGK
jgi:hypothetical protein